MFALRNNPSNCTYRARFVPSLDGFSLLELFWLHSVREVECLQVGGNGGEVILRGVSSCEGAPR